MYEVVLEIPMKAKGQCNKKQVKKRDDTLQSPKEMLLAFSEAQKKEDEMSLEMCQRRYEEAEKRVEELLKELQSV